MTGQRPALAWRETDAGTVPVSIRFDDPYFSLAGGVAETRHVFLAGNDLPGRFRDGLHIAELGFGTGLNFLCALAAFREAGISGRLHFTSFEAFPMTHADLERVHAGPTALPVEALLSASDPTRITGPDFTLRVVVGDARMTLPGWDGEADAWFLDGFSPAKNPELWEPNLLHAVARKTAHGGTFATYTAAGAVRRSLEAAGFAVTRCPGYGRKRHMSRGVLADAAASGGS